MNVQASSQASPCSTLLQSLRVRPRRLRQNPILRSLVQENKLTPSDFVYPLFVSEEGTERFHIPTLPGISRIPYQEIKAEVAQLYEMGLRSLMLFPVIHQDKKNKLGSYAYNENGLIQNTIKKIKDDFPETLLFADVALDPYTNHGHDGILVKDVLFKKSFQQETDVENDSTVNALCKQALSLARSGVDFICPSDMMDGRIGAIRDKLDQENFFNTGILAYSAKYASSFYGPFRDALSSGTMKLDKKTYQLNPANKLEAVKEVKLDIEEGADIVMIKPGLPYLDVVSAIKQNCTVPIAVYQVSGEYSMIKFAAEKNVLDEKAAVYETLLSMKRAGADILVTYYAKWAMTNLF